MVAELLRLKLRLLANAFRIPRSAAWASVGIIVGALFVIGLWAGAVLASELSEVTLRRVVVIAGALLSLGTFFVPLVVARSQLVHPRAFRPFGFRRPAIAGAILLTTLVGPAAVLIPLALAPLLLWTGDAERSVALLVIPLIVLEGVLAARLGVVIGVVLRSRPAVTLLVRVLTVVLLLAGLVVLAAHLLPTLAGLLPGSWWPTTLGVVLLFAPLRAPQIADTIAALPVGAFWRAPSSARLGDPSLVQQDLLLGGLAVLVLAALWLGWLAVSLRPTRRIPRERVALVPGWFRRLPSTPLGAVTARSLTYWARDPRYRSALLVLPVVPVVTLLALFIAGVPFSISVLVPLPIMLLLLAWSTLHNDIAFDSTALWTHVAAQLRGLDDRLGRALPVLAMGLLLVVVGVPLTAWGHGDGMIVPALLGVCAALLLGGIGVSSVVSARAPYPATRPGDAPFQQPQVAGASGSGTQAGSLLLVLLVAAPALAAMIAGVAGVPGPWYLTSFVVGIVAGVLVFAFGVRAGGAAFDRRGPELLEFATRH